MAATAGMFHWQIPVSVTSVKSFFFMFTQMPNANDRDYLRNGFEYHGLKQYRVLIRAILLNADWVNLDFALAAVNQKCYCEAVQVLIEAWSVHHKTDGNPSTKIIQEGKTSP